MDYDLARMATPARRRRGAVTLRDIAPPATLATDLYRAAYLPIIRAWRQHSDAINAAYATALSELVTDNAADVGDAIAAAEGELRRLVLQLTPAIERWALSVERWHRGRWRGAVLSATGVDLTTMIGPSDVRQTLETAIEWSTSLVRDVSDQVRQRIGNAVFSGLRNRTPARDVAREISEAVGMARDRSLRIASDQANKLTAALADERRREAGINAWQWKHSGKRHPRPEHVARDGLVYTDAPDMVGKRTDDADPTSAIMQKPPDDLPGQPPFCGCRSLSVLVWREDVVV